MKSFFLYGLLAILFCLPVAQAGCDPKVWALLSQQVPTYRDFEAFLKQVKENRIRLNPQEIETLNQRLKAMLEAGLPTRDLKYLLANLNPLLQKKPTILAGSTQNLLERELVDSLPQFDAMALAITARTLALLPRRPSGELVEIWLELAEKKISGFKPQELANSLWALAKLGEDLPGSFLRAWSQAATRNISAFNSQELSNSLWAFATLGEKPPASFLSAWTQTATRNISAFNSQDLSNSLWAFATLGEKPPASFLSVWTQTATRNISAFDPQNLSNSLWAFATLGEKPPASFLSAWAEAATRNIPTFNPQDLSNSLWTFATLGEKPPASFLSAWAEAATRNIPTFNPQDLSNTLWAFATLGEKPPASFLSAWTEAATRNIPTFNPQDLSNSLWAFATLGEKPPASFLSAWTEAATRNIPTFNPQDLSNSLWALTQLDPSRLPAILQTANASLNRHSFSPPDKRQLSFVFAYAKHVLKVSNFPDLSFSLPKPDFTITPIQRTTAQRFEAAGLEVQMEHIIPELHTTVDLYLPAHKIIVELDGAQHYQLDAQGKRVLVLQDQRRDEVLKAMGYTVIRIPNDQADVEVRRLLEQLGGR